MNDKKPLIIIAGPTAVGKSSISIELAKMIKGEIISADSMQVYKDLDIGTAKITKEEMQNIPHHMIDILDLGEEFSVSLFKKLFDNIVQEIYKRDHIPILVGGTGFYIQAALYGIDFSDNSYDISYRKELEKDIKEGKIDELYEELKKVDLEYSKIIHKNNHVKLIRALEYYHCTRTPLSKHNEEEKKKESRFNHLFTVITDDRNALYERINKRVDKMIDDGLLSEVKRTVFKNKSSPSLKGIGYHELIPFPTNDTELNEAIEKIKLNSRHYAKRQLTWFRREKDVVWINRNDFKNNKEIAEYILSLFKNKEW